MTPWLARLGSLLTAPLPSTRWMIVLPLGSGRSGAQWREIGVGEGIVGVAGHVDLRRVVLLELVVAELELAGHQFDDEQAVGDVEGRGGIAVGVVDLHAGLVVVLDLAGAAGRLGVGFVDDLAGGFRPPDPGTSDGAGGDRLVGAFPGALEGRVARRDGPGVERREEQQDQGRDNRYLLVMRSS